MILDGFNNQPVDKIISVPGPQGPPGLSGITQNLRRPQRNTLAAIGDSITAGVAISEGYYQAFFSPTYFRQIPILTHQRIRWCPGMYAVFGSYVSDQQSLQLPNVLAMNPLPGACVIGSGAAEIVNNVSYNFNTNVGLLKSMVASLLAVGVVPILWCVPPIRTTAFAVDVTTINVRLNQWNAWIRRYAAQNGFAVIDAHTALSQVDGTHIPGTTNDLLHPNAKGQRLIAQQAIADGLADIFPPNSLVNTSRTTDELTNLFNNGTINLGLFTTDSNSDGVADGLTKSGTSTASVVIPAPSDQMLGNWQQITVSAGNSSSVSAQITSGWSAGDVIALSFRIQTAGMESSNCEYKVGLKSDTAGGFTLPDGTSTTVLWNGLDNWTAVDIADGELYVEWTVPSAATNIYFYSWIMSVSSGIATLRVGEVTVRNLTTGGLLQ